MTDEPEEADEPKGDVIELNVDDLPTWAALMKANPVVAHTLLRETIFRTVHQHDVPHKVETISYQEMQYQWILNHIVEPVQLKVVSKPSANRPPAGS
jgi:hypothetical protein